MNPILSMPQTITLLSGGTATLAWKEWVCWDDLKQKRYPLPPGRINKQKNSGVYEVALDIEAKNGGKRLTIGKATDLNDRVGHLLKGTSHSEGERIKKAIDERRENPQSMYVRWASTDKYLEVEVCLFREYLLTYNWEAPKYCCEALLLNTLCK